MPIYSFKLRSDENVFADDAGDRSVVEQSWQRVRSQKGALS